MFVFEIKDKYYLIPDKIAEKFEISKEAFTEIIQKLREGARPITKIPVGSGPTGLPADVEDSGGNIYQI